jgi:dihydroxyacetone synthase
MVITQAAISITESVSMLWPGISNGMAAFAPQTIIPGTSIFFVFYLYAAPAVGGMGALQKLQVIHVAIHDSIGTAEDRPTHQPIELAALWEGKESYP